MSEVKRRHSRGSGEGSSGRPSHACRISRGSKNLSFGGPGLVIIGKSGRSPLRNQSLHLKSRNTGLRRYF